MTLAIPEELYKEMQFHSEIKWSEVARKAFEMKVSELHWMDKLIEKSELTEEDVNRIGHKIKHAMFERLEKEAAERKKV